MTAAADRAAEMEWYGQDLAHHAAMVVDAVHDYGPDEVTRRVQRALALPHPDGADPVMALIVALAAAAPRTPGDVGNALDWVRTCDPTPDEPTRPRSLTPAHLRRDRGGLHPQAKLTEADVREIRRRVRSQTERPSDIAADFGIRRQYVWKIVTRQVWAHVPDDPQPIEDREAS